MKFEIRVDEPWLLGSNELSVIAILVALTLSFTFVPEVVSAANVVIALDPKFESFVAFVVDAALGVSEANVINGLLNP